MKIKKSQIRKIIKESMGMADHPDQVDDAQYDRGYQDGLDDYPPAENATLDYDAGYEQGANDRRDRMSRPMSEGTIRTSEKQLRKIIREALMTESASEQAKALLDSEYTIASEKDAPGIRRDTNRITTYTRNDGQPVPPEDLKLLQARDDEVRKKGGAMARLMGVYTSSISQDGNSLVVKYHRTTAG